MMEEFAKLKNLRKEVKFMSDELSSMNDALERLVDVDELDPQTKRWRNTLRELSYDIEDIIDDFMRKIGEKDNNSWFVRKTIRRLKTSIFRHRIANQLEEIKKLVHETSDRHKRYDLQKVIPQSSNDVPIDPRVKTLYETAANLVGLEGRVNELVNRLEDKEKKLKVVSIVGFGGLGKTTLANVVYSKLKCKYDHCAFLPVSQKPNIPKLLLSLLSQLGSGPPSQDCGLNVLLDTLREHLKNKRYLIVIDDIWNEDAWHVIKCASPENNLCSRVVATTRIQYLAKTCCSQSCDYILNMKPLSNEESRRLFFGRIFDSEETCPQQFKDVSVQILRKCGGLPLAIISIAGLLATGSSNQDEWDNIQNSLGSTNGTKLTLEGMRQILNLSYKDLPRQLKTCLLYIGMYPEDYKIDRSELERQWIAEGFVCKQNGQDVEKIARNCFNELVNRSLIQPVKFDKEGSVTECIVHDMMLDLILLKSAEENFLTIIDGPQAITGLDYKVRRLSLRLDDANDARILLGNISISQVRSVMTFGRSCNVHVLPLSEFKFLRVLYVDSEFGVRFTGLGQLYQLRYLMTRSHARSILFGLYPMPLFQIDPVHLSYLLHLNIGLSGFNILFNSLDNIIMLGELTSLTTLTLTGELYDCGGDNHLLCGDYCHDPDDTARRLNVLGSSLRKLCRLESLYLYLCEYIDGLFASFPPPQSLQRLHTGNGFRTYGFFRVPNITKEHHNLRELQLKVYDLPNEDVGILGELPSLVILELKVINPLDQMVVIYGGFPVLMFFGLSSSRASYLTFQAGAMPMLQRLQLTFRYVRNEPQMAQGRALAGIEHLPALEKVAADIKYCGDAEFKKESAESALRTAVSIHPGNPFVEVYFS